MAVFLAITVFVCVLALLSEAGARLSVALLVALVIAVLSWGLTTRAFNQVVGVRTTWQPARPLVPYPKPYAVACVHTACGGPTIIDGADFGPASIKAAP